MTEQHQGGAALPEKVISYDLRGGNAEFYLSTEHEVLNSGPADTGKSFAGILKLHAACASIPKVQVLLCRKTFHSLAGTIVKTVLNITAGQNVRPYGGENPSRFIYPNGSTIWLGGLDNSGSFLSGYFDYVFVNQTEEITLDDWEMLGSRCTGRNAVVKHPQLLGDPNPSWRSHWILERARQGKLRLLKTTHRDNPALYDKDGNQTEDGKIRIARLSSNLTGVRRQRYFEGIWANAEGAIYADFNPSTHICERNENEVARWFLGIDFGFTDPCCILLIGCDYDRRWHIFDEYYHSGVLPESLVKKAVEWFAGKQCEFAACDSSGAGLIASMVASGVNALGAVKGRDSIVNGIGLVQNKLLVRADGRPRLTVSSKCINTIRELEAYRWKADMKDVPVDEDNHALDALRYAVLVDTAGTGSFSALSSIILPDAGTSVRSITPRQWPGR